MAKWKIKADYLQGCNCDWGCPCNFNAPPKDGRCEGTIGLHIREGFLDNVRLDGVDVVIACKWPGQIHEGNGTIAIYLDPSTTPQQRDAILSICSGQAGGLPFSIISQTFKTVLPPRIVPTKVTFAGENSSMTAGSHLEVTMEAMRNPVTKQPVHASVKIPDGFIFQESPVYSNKTCWVKDEGLNYSYPGQNAHACQVEWAN
jgi:hypothetical protein